METWLKSPSGCVARDSPIEGVSKLNPIVETNENVQCLDITEGRIENDELKKKNYDGLDSVTETTSVNIDTSTNTKTLHVQSTTPPGNTDNDCNTGGSASENQSSQSIKRRLINKYGKNKVTPRRQSSVNATTPRSENIKTLLLSAGGGGSNRKRKRDSADNIMKCSKSLRLDSNDTEKENTQQQEQNSCNDKCF